MRDYRTHLQTVLERSPATVNNALAALDDFYIRRGLGPAAAARVRSPPPHPARSTNAPSSATCAQSKPALRHGDQALALVPFYAGARISEIVALDVDDVARFARKGVLRIYGKGERVRKVPIHPKLHRALTGWLAERTDWPGAHDSPALFLNQRGQRLSVRGAHDIVIGIAAAAGLDDTRPSTSCGTRSRPRWCAAAPTWSSSELLGHARLETTRGYTRPSAEDPTPALDLLLVDQ